jgi:hypothetical protein
MRLRRLAIGIGVGIVFVAVLGLILVPTLGPWIVRTRVLPRLGERLGRTVQADHIVCGYHQLHLYGVTVAGPDDAPGAPLVHIDQIDVDYDPLRSLVGPLQVGVARITHPVISLVRYPDGHDNVSDLIARLRTPSQNGATAHGVRPSRILVDLGVVTVDDQADGLQASVGEVDADVVRGEDGDSTAHLANVAARVVKGPQAAADSMDVTFRLAQGGHGLDGLPVVQIHGGSVSLLRSLALTGIEGGINPDPQTGHAGIALSGGYDNAPVQLWHAQGWVDPIGRAGALDVSAQRFTLDRIAPFLSGTLVLRPQDTSIDSDLSLAYSAGKLTYDGHLDVSGLNLFQTMIAPVPIPGLSFSTTIHGAVDLAARTLTLDQAELRLGELTIDLQGSVHKMAAASQPASAAASQLLAVAPPDDQPSSSPTYLPGWLRTLSFDAHVTVPPVACQTLVTSLPGVIVPYLRGFVLSGSFKADIDLSIDFSNLDALTLDGDVGIWGCHVQKAPKRMDATRLLTTFEQHVESEPGQDLAFLVGPENPDYASYADISPYMVDAVLTTEDGSFFRNKGFNGEEFANALRTDLEAGHFAYGASSITMQTVKNVLLSHDKTLSRKLQELFLTWYITGALPKERILEIYLNVIEFGPGIYGVGPAAERYFGKAPKDLTPVEAAFLASILPSPKRYYSYYCKGALPSYWDSWVHRIVSIMHDRGHITQDEYDTYKDEPFAFATTVADQQACLSDIDRMEKAITKDTADEVTAWRKRALGQAEAPP